MTDKKTGREWADYSRSGHAPLLEDIFGMAIQQAMTREMARLMVDSIVKDLEDRSGLENEWDALDSKIRDEIVEEWQEIINSCWLRGTP